MLITNLFENVLIEPVIQHDADRLLIVSGYATPSMADWHLSKLIEQNKQISVDLIVGMTKRDGIERAQHQGLQKISQTGIAGSSLACRYIVQGSPVHAKTYLWLRGNDPIKAFMGSANYTRTAFSNRQVEALSECSPDVVNDFFNNCMSMSISCLRPDIETHVSITQKRILHETVAGRMTIAENFETVTLSLLVHGTDETHNRSGLNWGQRDRRDRNQAYIPVPMNIARSDFFPDIAEPFTVETDDGLSFVMAKAQQGGKALHTTQNNSIIGEYIRNRIGVASGEYVTGEHLRNYGRTDITFIKIDEEHFFLDFSV